MGNNINIQIVVHLCVLHKCANRSDNRTETKLLEN